MSEIIEEVRKVALSLFNAILQDMLLEASNNLQGPPSETLSSKTNRLQIVKHFNTNFSQYFDILLGRQEEDKKQLLYFEVLALAQKREFEEMITIEGMVAATRNLCQPNFVPFNSRLDSLVSKFDIDENNNPLDPDQITTAFEQAIQFLNLDALNRLSLFRDFNERLLKQLDIVLMKLNELLKKRGILPDLKAETPKTQSIQSPSVSKESPELLSMMQGLLHGTPSEDSSNETATDVNAMVPTGSGIMQPLQFTLNKEGSEKKIEVLDQQQLMKIIDSIQKVAASIADAKQQGDTLDQLFDPYSIVETLGLLLKKGQRQEIILAVDRNSSDVINLVTMLYGAIWQDESLPNPVKNLIGETQLTTTKLALTDKNFFDAANHPAREIINELANAGMGLLEVERLDEDPLYQKMRSLVTKVTTDYKGDNTLFDVSLKEFRRFIQKEEKEKLKRLEEKIQMAPDRKSCLDDIHELISKKITERLVGRKIHAFFRESLESYLHKFLVTIMFKGGPESKDWKQALNTLDVILWTVEFNKDTEDKDRVKTANSRIMNSIKKALIISGLKEGEIATFITHLKQAQTESFGLSNYKGATQLARPGPPDSQVSKAVTKTDSAPSSSKVKEVKNTYLQQVDSFSVGIWVDISVPGKQVIRCKLAARIPAIDKYIFVNRDGVKVVEKTRVGLAQDLKQGSIKVISDGLLFSRALESVIGNLQESQDQQNTNGVFQTQT